MFQLLYRCTFLAAPSFLGGRNFRSHDWAKKQTWSIKNISITLGPFSYEKYVGMLFWNIQWLEIFTWCDLKWQLLGNCILSLECQSDMTTACWLQFVKKVPLPRTQWRLLWTWDREEVLSLYFPDPVHLWSVERYSMTVLYWCLIVQARSQWFVDLSYLRCCLSSQLMGDNIRITKFDVLWEGYYQFW